VEKEATKEEKERGGERVEERGRGKCERELVLE
jgi:hypothetical protein